MIEKKKESRQIPAATAFPFGTGDQVGLRIVFMGTPEFAVASLDKLLQNGYEVVGVVTAPDKAAGRGMELQQSAVKKYAVAKGLNVLQPEKLKDPGFIEALRSLRADLQVVVAFRMLPEVVWNMPRLGTINVHGSLLPQYRGAAPINWAIINGEKFTGVTTFRLKHEIDTGNILLQESFPIAENDDAGMLHDIMKEAGANLLLKTLRSMDDQGWRDISQEQAGLTVTEPLKHAPKIFTETCRIDWNKPVEQVYNLVRGLSPYPGAFTLFQGRTMKIFKAAKIMITPAVKPGEFETDHKNHLRFACTDGYLDILLLQLEGKKKMEVKDFLRGFRFTP